MDEARWLPAELSPELSPTAFADTAAKNLDLAAAADVDEVHIELNLADMPPHQQTSLLEAAATRIAR